MHHPEFWGPLRSRYEPPNPQPRLLALDGGGIRGLITLDILETLEKLLGEKSVNEDDFRLCQWFDYVAATSTGAIIAAGLARGMSVEELIQFYRENGVAMFESTHLMQRLASFYKAGPLRKKLREVFGADSIASPPVLDTGWSGRKLSRTYFWFRWAPEQRRPQPLRQK